MLKINKDIQKKLKTRYIPILYNQTLKQSDPKQITYAQQKNVLYNLKVVLTNNFG